MCCLAFCFRLYDVPPPPASVVVLGVISTSLPRSRLQTLWGPYSCLQVSRSLYAPSGNPSLDLAPSFLAGNSEHHYRWKLVDFLCINGLVVSASYNPLEPIPLIVLLKGTFCLPQGIAGFRSLVFGYSQGSPAPVLLSINLPDTLIKILCVSILFGDDW